MLEPSVLAGAPRARASRSQPFAKPLATLILAGLLSTAWAQPAALTEREAIQGALSRPAWQQAQSARLETAESAVAAARLWPNPELGVERERVDTVGGDETERTIALSQTFDVSGRRALRRDAASERLDAARLESLERRLDTIAEVRRAFAESLYRERSEAAIGRWLARVEAATEVAARLAKAGEASGYDRRRIEREAQTARARLAGALADAARSREELAALAGRPPNEAPQLMGELLPDPVPPLETALQNLRERPDLAGVRAQAAAFERERDAARRGWIPDLTLSAGQKRVTEPGHTDRGTIVGVSFSIPLFDRGQAEAQKSGAQAQLLRAEHALALARAQAGLRGVWRQATELHQAADTFRRDSLAGSRDLARIAEAAYRAGEASLLELLDAYRAELDAETTELDLALRARLARIELDSLSGVSFHE